MLTSSIAIMLGLATLSAALMAGTYFAFSGFIMRSLDELGPVAASDTMNSINRGILKSWFIPLFFGSTLLYVILALLALFNAAVPGRWILFATSAVYIVGMSGCTAALNVPLNNRLAGQTSTTGKSETWRHYYLVWTRWNTLRTIASAFSAVSGVYYLASHY